MPASKKHPSKLAFCGTLSGLLSEAKIRAAKAGLNSKRVKGELAKLDARPQDYLESEVFGELAKALTASLNQAQAAKSAAGPAPFNIFGTDIDPEALAQMREACALPVSRAGAILPDAHVGYGLPIGGVLAVEAAIIPYAVGVDIACRMKLSLLDLPPEALSLKKDELIRALNEQTRFGVGAGFAKGQRKEHAVLDRDWGFCRCVKDLKDKAHEQLGTSGAGNHFVEFGRLCLTEPLLGLEPGEYLGLLSHSGSRGPGNEIATHYSELAMRAHPELKGGTRRLAWLELKSPEGREYFAAMRLMGLYSQANHELIHAGIVRQLGAQVLAGVENHHNFAWLEKVGGRELVVHRKGATPAAAGLLGVVPGSMASPGFLVRGLGNPASLYSCAHGAGRALSRKKALASFNWAQARRLLDAAGVTLVSAGLDEVPQAYKDIKRVMAEQSELVEVVARFDPVIVKMAGALGRG